MSTIDPPTTESESRIRVSNDERAEVVEALHHALGEGRLDLAETETRVASVYSARYRHELPALLADLPNAATGSTLLGREAPSWTEIRQALVWRIRLLVLRDDAAAAPTGPQCRTAAWAAALALVWFLLCAFVGAVAMAA